MPFGLYARMGRRNHAFDGGPEVLRVLPWQPILGRSLVELALLALVVRIIASDMVFDSRGGFSGSSYPMKT